MKGLIENRIARPGLPWLLSVWFLFCLALPFTGGAYTYLQVGVDSNFLIDGPRVLFAQADGSLTSLSLDSGEVLARNNARDYSGTLQRVPQGILVLNERRITLIDPANFLPSWETDRAAQPNVIDDALVSGDGTGLVECRALAGGTVRWTCALPGACDIVAEGNLVLLHRSATYEEAESPVLVLVSATGGKELVRKSPPAGVHWGPAFLDGTNVYVVTGPVAGKRSEYDPERLAVWNTRGVETGSLPIPPELRQLVRDGALFELDGKTFWRGRVYAGRQFIPLDKRVRLNATRESTGRIARTFDLAHEIGPGIRFIERSTYVAGTNARESSLIREIEYRSNTNHWTGILPYLSGGGQISAVAQVQERLLIGTNLGQVECINAGNGASLWLYVFPTLRRTISFSSGDPPPTMTEAAALFRRDNSAVPVSGMQLINGPATKPRLIKDPHPCQPFRDLNRQLALAWGGAAIPLILLLGIHVAPRLRAWHPALLGSIAAWLSLAVFFGQVFAGTISPGSALALKVALIAGFAVGLANAVRSYGRGDRLEALILVVTFAGLGVFALL